MSQQVKTSTVVEYDSQGRPITSYCHNARGERVGRHWFCSAQGCGRRIRTPKKQMNISEYRNKPKDVISVKETTFQHVKRRALERYGCNLSLAHYLYLCKYLSLALKENRLDFIRKKDQIYLCQVYFNNCPMICIFNNFTNDITSFVPATVYTCNSRMLY